MSTGSFVGMNTQTLARLEDIRSMEAVRFYLRLRGLRACELGGPLVRIRSVFEIRLD
jgi:hypothetical protein